MKEEVFAIYLGNKEPFFLQDPIKDQLECPVQTPNRGQTWTALHDRSEF